MHLHDCGSGRPDSIKKEVKMGKFYYRGLVLAFLVCREFFIHFSIHQSRLTIPVIRDRRDPSQWICKNLISIVIVAIEISELGYGNRYCFFLMGKKFGNAERFCQPVTI